MLRADDRILETATFEKVLAALKKQPEAKPNAPQVLATPDQPTATWIVQDQSRRRRDLERRIFPMDIQTETSGVVEGFIVRYKLLAATQMTGVDAKALQNGGGSCFEQDYRRTIQSAKGSGETN